MDFANGDDVKLVALLNEKVDTGKLMNALAHCVAGAIRLADAATIEALQFIQFPTAHGESLPSISARSFVVLRASNSEIRKARERATGAGLGPVCFVESMTGGSWMEQVERTKAIATDAMTFYALVIIGKGATVNPITRRCSLWRERAQVDPPVGATGPRLGDTGRSE